MKPGRFNFYLFISILLVGVGYYALNFNKVRNLPIRGETGSLVPFNMETLREIRIEADSFNMEIRGAGEQWQLEQPVTDLASIETIEAMVNALNEIRFTPVVGLNLSASPTQYGTEPPYRTLEFSDGYETQTILVGQDQPVGDGTYIRFPDDRKLYVTSSSIREYLPDSFEEFRDLSFFNGVLENITRLEYSRGEQTVEIRRDGARSWSFVRPINGRGNRAGIESLLQKILTLEVSGVAADRVSDPGVYGIDENSRHLKIGWADKPAQTIQIGSREARANVLYASISDRDSIYTLPGGLMDFLDVDPETLRDRRPLPATAETLQSISIQHPNFTTLLTRKENNWIVQGTGVQNAQLQKVRAFIALWTAPVIESFSSKASSTNQTEAEKFIRLEFEAKTETEAIGKWIFESPLSDTIPSSVEILSVSDQLVFKVPSALLNPATLRPIMFYEPNLWTFPVEKTQRLEFGANDATNLTQMATTPQSQVLSILRSIEPLSIAGESSEMLPKTFFSQDTEKLIFRLPAEDGISRTLLLGNITENGNRFVKLLGSSLIYLVDGSTLNKAVAKITAPSSTSDD